MKNPKEEVKSSEEWQKQFPNTKVLDPDGWDRKNYQYSWFKEKITLTEYNSRLNRSTVKGIIQKREPKQEIVGYRLKSHINRNIVDGILKNPMPIWNDADKSVYFIKGHVAGCLVAKMRELQILDLWFTPIYEFEEVKSDWLKQNHLDYYYKEGIMSNKPKQVTLEVKRNYEKHSLTKTKGYKLWCNIIQRCYNPKNHSYKYYGEKGVIMEDYFKNSYENFINWIKGIANYEKWLNSSELSLDRIDNTLGYVRGNIKFSTKTEQVENQNLRLDNKSGYKGVCYHKLNKKYGATITINKSKVFLGYYDTALEAALVYDNYVLKNNLNRKTNL